MTSTNKGKCITIPKIYYKHQNLVSKLLLDGMSKASQSSSNFDLLLLFDFAFLVPRCSFFRFTGVASALSSSAAVSTCGVGAASEKR